MVAAACGGEPEVARPAPLGPLAGAGAVDTDRFVDAAACGQCHTASDTALRDPAGRDVSPVALWRPSMMALAARDPLYLAVLAEERARAPGDAATVDRTCLRCHAPAGSEESGGALGFEELVAGDSPAARLGREGVTCTLCHQIGASGLGQEASFTGGFSVGYQREMFGPHASPYADPMRMFVGLTPALGEHVMRSELCATCHTVIVGDVVEQATYLEWRSSSVAATLPCQGCHVPPIDADAVPLRTPISKYPAGLSARAPVGRHRFVGGNAYMLRLIAGAEAWATTGLAPGELEAAALEAEQHLASAARLTVTPQAEAGTTALVVGVENLTGHKLPTGYPSRRMWLHVTVRDGARVLFESGAAAADGSLAGDVAPPHRDRIDDPAQVQVWQAVLVDGDGAPTHRALDAVGYGKDNRVLPAGFAPGPLDAARVASVGVDGDTSFVAGSDRVTYLVGAPPPGAVVEVELLYQSLSPGLVDAIDAGRTPMGTRFVDLARAAPITPIVMARAQLVL
jgi:hypothetical protein